MSSIAMVYGRRSGDLMLGGYRRQGNQNGIELRQE